MTTMCSDRSHIREAGGLKAESGRGSVPDCGREAVAQLASDDTARLPAAAENAARKAPQWALRRASGVTERRFAVFRGLGTPHGPRRRSCALSARGRDPGARRSLDVLEVRGSITAPCRLVRRSRRPILGEARANRRPCDEPQYDGTPRALIAWNVADRDVARACSHEVDAGQIAPWRAMANIAGLAALARPRRPPISGHAC